MVNVHFIDYTQPLSDVPGSPLWLDDKILALTFDWLGATVVSFVATHAIAFSQLVNVTSEMRQVRFRITRLLSRLDKLRVF